MISSNLFQASLFASSSLSRNLTETDQRFTPPAELEKVRKALGGVIGLDPCANPGKTVPARHHITESENCFTSNWGASLFAENEEDRTVFMNPPYSVTASFIQELCKYLEDGQVRSAVTLTLSGVLSNKSTQNLVRRYGVAICHPFGRINFVNGGKSNDRDVVYILWGERSDFGLFCQHMTGLISKIRQED